MRVNKNQVYIIFVKVIYFGKNFQQYNTNGFNL